MASRAVTRQGTRRGCGLFSRIRMRMQVVVLGGWLHGLPPLSPPRWRRLVSSPLVIVGQSSVANVGGRMYPCGPGLLSAQHIVSLSLFRRPALDTHWVPCEGRAPGPPVRGTRDRPALDTHWVPCEGRAPAPPVRGTRDDNGHPSGGRTRDPAVRARRGFPRGCANEA